VVGSSGPGCATLPRYLPHRVDANFKKSILEIMLELILTKIEDAVLSVYCTQ
jgi:phage terminase small subunit